jgi:hypothetical protein
MPAHFGPETRGEWLWKLLAGGLAVAFAVTFTWQQVRGSHTAAQVSTTKATLAAETKYLGEVATYANYLALTNFRLCAKLQTACPAPPHFPDPPHLPALGVHVYQSHH